MAKFLFLSGHVQFSLFSFKLIFSKVFLGWNVGRRYPEEENILFDNAGTYAVVHLHVIKKNNHLFVSDFSIWDV